MTKLRVIELCSGLGSQTEALKRLGVPHEVVAWADIDASAVKAYKILHNPKIENSGDMYKIKSLPECDLMVYSTPCQSFSMAGKREGAKKGSGTASSLIWEIERFLDDFKEREALPKYLLLENVKGLVTKEFLPFFKSWLDLLEKNYGYNSYWMVQNAKGFNVPQNRERVMAVSIRKDCDNGWFEFPEMRPCKVKLKDILEKKVDKKFYLSQRAIDGIMDSNFDVTKRRIQNKEGLCRTITAREYKDPACILDNAPIQLGELKGEPYNRMYEQSRRFYSEEGISPTCHTVGGGNLEIKVGIEVKPVMFAMRGRKPKNASNSDAGITTKQRLEMNAQGISNAVATVAKDNLVGEELTILAPNNWSHKAGDGKATRKRREIDYVSCLSASNSSDQRPYVKEYVDRMSIQDGTMINPYNCIEIRDLAPTQTTQCCSIKSSASVIKFEETDVKHENEELLKETNVSDKKGRKIGYYLSKGKAYRVRKLIPKETLRLMGWTDDRIELLLNAKTRGGKRALSDSACYCLAGNSIVIQHLMGIFGQLLRVKWKEKVFGSHDNLYQPYNDFYESTKPSEEQYSNWIEY